MASKAVYLYGVAAPQDFQVLERLGLLPEFGKYGIHAAQMPLEEQLAVQLWELCSTNWLQFSAPVGDTQDENCLLGQPESGSQVSG